MIKNTKIPENWIEVRITNDKLQELENIGDRKILISFLQTNTFKLK